MRYKKGINIFARKESIAIEGVNGAHYLTDEELVAHEVYPIVEPTYNLETHRLGQLVFNNNKYEFETIAYTAEELQNKKIQGIVQFMQTKKADGQAYVNDVKTNITISLIGLLAEDVNLVDKELVASVEPLLDLIEKGDWWSSVNLELPYPTVVMAENTFLEVKTYAQNYVMNNYPTDI